MIEPEGMNERYHFVRFSAAVQSHRMYGVLSDEIEDPFVYFVLLEKLSVQVIIK